MILIDNIGCLVSGHDETAWQSNAALLLDGERVHWQGPAGAIPNVPTDQRIDANSCVVLPGLIDCHTHLVFAGSRADEFARRMNNESYQSIMAHGGGIMSTVRATRAANDEQLIALAVARADRIIAQGVTTVEVKSGYGLSVHDECRILRIVKKLSALHPLDFHPTFLGAHVVPAEFKDKGDAYVDAVVHEMLPQIAEEKLAIDCDVFCDNGAFSQRDAHRILRAAHDLGLGLRAHVQQLGVSGGVTLVGELPIKSVSHADFLTDADVALLARAKTVVEALPIASLFLRSSAVTPVNALRTAQIPLAIATDFNPGSAMCHDLMMAARLAVTYYGFSIPDAVRAITTNAARALGRNDIGTLAKNAQADVLITNCHSVEELFYDWNKHPKQLVIKRGRVIC